MSQEAQEQQQESEPSSNRPMAKFTGSGGLSVAVWKQKSESGAEYYSVKMERSYKDKDDNFQSTQYLRDSDLLRAQKLLEQADEWIEQDRGRSRGLSTARNPQHK